MKSRIENADLALMERIVEKNLVISILITDQTSTECHLKLR